MPGRWFAVSITAMTLVVCACASRADDAPAQARSDRFRPAFHFTPERNWMNDPNGLVFLDGEWHLFHQYNPEGDTWGHMSWGHAVSKDLATWDHLPVALREEAGVMIFSGSAVIDRRNTSGFGKDGRPPMVAIYTGHTPTNQSQHIAYSTDRGRTWTKFAGNPVIDRKLKDFRDPKVFWHEPTGRWVMAVALPTAHAVALYASPDLKQWKLLSEFEKNGSTAGAWECPDLFELPLLRGGKPTGESRWVLSVNTSGGAPAGGSGCQYFVGRFDGTRFTNDNPKDVTLWADHGPDFYAAQSWSDVPKEDGRRIWIGWMTNLRYAPAEPTTPYRGAMTVPRELSLVETASGLRLAQRWVRELANRAGDWRSSRQVEVNGSTPIDLGRAAPSRQPKLKITFRPAAKPAKSYGLKLIHGPPDAGQFVTVTYDPAAKQIGVDRTRAGGTFHKQFPGRFSAALEPRPDGTITLDLVIDRSSVETFANDGVAVLTTSVFADAPLTGVDLISDGGPVSADVDLTAW